MPRLLFITYEFPPKTGPGVQRPFQTARLLADEGWDVTVLTVADPPTASLDDTPLRDVPENMRIETAWSLEPTRLLQWLRRGRGDDTPALDTGYSGASSGFIRLVQSFFFPDEKVGWTPYAMSAARRMHRADPFDAILASGPPFTAFRVAWKLSARLRIPWIADVRDPIYGNYFFEPPTAFHDGYMRRFEQKTVSRAAATVCATGPMTAAVRERNSLASSVHTITNGYDPALLALAQKVERPGFTLSYVGRFQGAITPDALVEAIDIACSLDEGFAKDVRVRFVSPEAPALTSALDERSETWECQVTGAVGHAEAIEEMVSADVLTLALPDTPEMRPVLTGKLPEYIGSRRPVLAMVGEGVAASTVRFYGAGAVVPPSDPAAAAKALLGMWRQWQDGSLPVPDEDVVRSFDRLELTRRYSALLKDVVNGQVTADTATRRD